MKHEDLDVWKKGIDIVTEIYKITAAFPPEEIYGITNQIRRAAVSIPSNIAEGCARFSNKETLKFISVAVGSVTELQTQFIIAQNLDYISDNSEILNKLEEIKKMLIGLSKYLKDKNKT